jgi:hypothetical protein
MPLLTAAALSALLAASLPARAQLLGLERFLPPPAADFSATVIMTGTGEKLEGRVYRTPQKERREFAVEGEGQIVIVRADLKKVWSLVPEEKIYIETTLEEALGRGSARHGRVEPKVTITTLGRETMLGMEVSKEKIAGEDIDGSPIDGTVWVSDKGIVLRVENSLVDDEGIKHQIRMELRDVKVGPQDAKLFEIPAEYRRAGQTRTGGLSPAPDAGG